MKIEPTTLRPTASRRVGGGIGASGGSEFAKTMREEVGTGQHNAIGGPVGLDGLTAVLAVQEPPDQMARPGPVNALAGAPTSCSSSWTRSGWASSSAPFRWPAWKRWRN